MKFSILALSALLVFIAAADPTTVSPSTITTTPEIQCAKSCKLPFPTLTFSLILTQLNSRRSHGYLLHSQVLPCALSQR